MKFRTSEKSTGMQTMVTHTMLNICNIKIFILDSRTMEDFSPEIAFKKSA